MNGKAINGAKKGSTRTAILWAMLAKMGSLHFPMVVIDSLIHRRPRKAP